MRYSNWDVILFPKESKTPIQEFRSNCGIVQDPEFIPDPTNVPTGPHEQCLPQQLPIVSSVVAALPNDAPFRISIHSWEPLVPISVAAKAVTRSNLYYEARVMIDGLRVAGSLFHFLGPLPQMIDISGREFKKWLLAPTCNNAYMCGAGLDKTGKQESLRFPLFRPELLRGGEWNPSEIIGRVRITITEGYLRAPGILPFLPLKNLVSFSFQPIPLHILEGHAIAWPNPSMWNNTCQLYYNPPSNMRNEFVGAELHAHSPRRQAASVEKPSSVTSMESVHMLGTASMSSGFNRPMPFLSMGKFGFEPVPVDPIWAQVAIETDPFMGNGPQPEHNRFTTSEDQSMPDYSRSMSSTSGHHPAFPAPGQLDKIDGKMIRSSKGHGAGHGTRLDELVQTLQTSIEEPAQGQIPPQNTHANTPLGHAQSHGVAELGPGSASDTITVDQRVGTPSNALNIAGTTTPLNQVNRNPLRSPRPGSGSAVKGRKEGHASDVDLPLRVRRHASRTFAVMEDKENSTGVATANSSAVISSEGKRKRANNQSTLNDPEVGAGSPTRKSSRRMVSRTCSELSTGAAEERNRARTPLEEVDNI